MKKQEFITDYVLYSPVSKMVLAVMLPTGNIELIINTDGLEEKIEYYKNAYDDDLNLKANSSITIVNWMFV